MRVSSYQLMKLLFEPGGAHLDEFFPRFDRGILFQEVISYWQTQPSRATRLAALDRI